MREALLRNVLLCGFAIGLLATAGEGTLQTTPFEPSILRDALTPSLTPDSKTMLFTQYGPNTAFIFESNRAHAGWARPHIAWFSGKYKDMDAVFSPDGNTVVFTSKRPPVTTSFRLWAVTRTASTWSAPVLLPISVPIPGNFYAPSVASDGSIYLLHSDRSLKHRLFRVVRKDGRYLAPEQLPFNTVGDKDADPAVAPDQSFLVFVSAGRQAGERAQHVFMVYRCGNGWGRAFRLHYAGDASRNDGSPLVSANGKTLYFTSSSANSQQILSAPLPPSLRNASCN